MSVQERASAGRMGEGHMGCAACCAALDCVFRMHAPHRGKVQVVDWMLYNVQELQLTSGAHQSKSDALYASKASESHISRDVLMCYLCVQDDVYLANGLAFTHMPRCRLEAPT